MPASPNSDKGKKGKLMSSNGKSNEGGSGIATRSIGLYSVDSDADQSSNITDNVNQNLSNDSSSNVPISQSSSIGYGNQHSSTAIIHTVVSRPVYDGKIEHFPSWDMQLEAHLHE